MSNRSIEKPGARAAIPAVMATIAVAFALILVGALCWGTFFRMEVNAIFVLSLCYWIGLAVLLVIPDWRLIVLPVLLLTVPGPVDDLFPSVFIGPASELGANPVAIISYLDISIWLMTLLQLAEGRLLTSRVDVVSILLMLLVTTVGGSFVYHLLQEPHFLIGAGITGVIMFVRMLLIYLNVRCLLNGAESLKKIVMGLALSLPVLFLDSSFTTITRDLARLTAGTLGNNVFGNILAVIGVLMLALSIHSSRNRRVASLATIVAFGMIVLTGTRMSLVAFVFGAALVVLFRKPRRRMLRGVIIGVGVVTLIAVALGIVAQKVPGLERMNITTAISNIDISDVESTEWSPESTSLLTRFLLWRTSYNMIAENPIVGVGPGQFNGTKYDYGFTESVMIDAHNGFLHLWAEEGSIALLAYILIIAAVLVRSFSGRRTNWDPMTTAFGIALVIWWITELTNAGLYKKNVSSLIIVLVAAAYTKIQAPDNHVPLSSSRNYKNAKKEVR